MKKEKILKIDGNDYQIKFPSVGEMIAIESMKMSFTKNRYVEMSSSDLQSHKFALDMADTVSYFSVLIPELKENLKIKGWWEADPYIIKNLMKVYQKQFIPWFKPILDDLYKYEDDEDESETEEQ